MSVTEKTVKKSGGLGETVNVVVQALILALIIRTLAVPALLHSVRLDASDLA